MTEMKFFVYGSMTEGCVHFATIKDFVESSEPAQIQAAAYRLQVGFPVLQEGGADWVPGELLCVRTRDLLLQLLDQFHGCNEFDPAQGLHLRKQTQVLTAQGEQKAWVYFINPAKRPKTARLIEGGNWRESLLARPPLTERLTDRQKQYVLRLGQCSGREIIPIDLGLYRELMNLEIIVDKGRRLALSKLGHEVFRYLG